MTSTIYRPGNWDQMTAQQQATWIANVERWEAKAKRGSGARRERIEAAGIAYPTDWEQMGSSEKDLWEHGSAAWFETVGLGG